VGLCRECGDRNLTENIYGLSHRTGDPWRRWRRAMAASVGGVLVDDVLDAE
jgi:hypothetical protein